MLRGGARRLAAAADAEGRATAAADRGEFHARHRSIERAVGAEPRAFEHQAIDDIAFTAGRSTDREARLTGPSADANPYLALSASLTCGYSGMVEGLKPSEPITGRAYDLPFTLPRNIEESLRLLRDRKPHIEILGDRFVIAYTAIKESEYETFLQVISSWEREHLLLNV